MISPTLFRIPALAAVVLLAGGCAMQAPRYQPSIDNADVLKKAAIQPVAVGSFTVQAGGEGVTAIGLRGSSMTSPVGNDYAAYLADAIAQELKLAGRLAPDATLAVSGLLMRNDIAAGGFSTNSGDMQARFTVRRGAEVRYDEVKRAELSWESSFIGAVAIPKAQQQYPMIVQKLLADLFGDAKFQAALR